MNLKFIAGGILLIAGLSWGADQYWKHEFEQQARDTLKKVHMDPQTQQRLESAGLPISGDILNQYPNIITYVKLTDFIGDQLPAQIQSHVQTLGCSHVDGLRGKEPEIVQAYLAVYKEDQVVSTYTIQNKYGRPLFEHKQALADCPNFSAMALNSDAAFNEAPESTAVSEKTLKMNEKLENGS